MGLESHVNGVVESLDPVLRDAYYWHDGMNVIDERDAAPLLEVLNGSGEFGHATYNKETKKIEFGIHPQFQEMPEALEAWLERLPEPDSEQFLQFLLNDVLAIRKICNKIVAVHPVLEDVFQENASKE